MMLAILLLATLAVAAPPGERKLIITDDFFVDCAVIYTSRHDIVDISVPLNDLNFGEDIEKIESDHVNVLFFVEADLKENEDKDFKGLYVYKNGQAKKILDNGQSATFAKDEKVYFGAKDGIYKYNVADVTAEKYGNVTDSVIQMAVDLKNAFVYYLTEDYVVYKFDENEVQSTKVEAVKDARDIAFDYYGNLIFYDASNQLYFYNGKTVDKVKGLKEKPTKISLVKAPVILEEVAAVVDGTLYSIKENGTSHDEDIVFRVEPTAFAPEAVFIQYYGYNKKLYQYSYQSVTENCKIDALYAFINDKEDIKTLQNAKKPFDN